MFVFLLRRFSANWAIKVSTCTAAISAACYVANTSEDSIFKERRWAMHGGIPNGVGHCPLVPAEVWDSGQAQAPLDGVVYGVTALETISDLRAIASFSRLINSGKGNFERFQWSMWIRRTYLGAGR